MLVTSEFRIDKVQMTVRRNSEGYLEYLKKQAAANFGTEVHKHIPFEKIEEESFRGRVPDYRTEPVQHYPNHPFHDVYKMRVMVCSAEKWFNFKEKLHSLTLKLSEWEFNGIVNAIRELESI